MTTCVRVLTTKTSDSSPSLLLVAVDGSKILVNCGEGCQRAFLEFSQRVATIKAVCLTHIANDAIGGLPGMILTAADVHSTIRLSKDLDVAVDSNTERSVAAGFELIGPSGSKALLHSLRHFIKRDAFAINVIEDSCESYSPPSNGTKAKRHRTDGADGFTIDAWTFQATAASPKGQKRPRRESKYPITSYMFATRPQLGKFLPEEAMRLGVPKGPLFGKLKGGQSVTFLKDSRICTVSSHQVVEASIPGKAILVLRCPSDPVDLERFWDENEFEQRACDRGLDIELVVFLCSRDVLGHPTCRKWKRELSSDVQFIFLSIDREACGDSTPFHAAKMGSFSRSLLSPDIFLMPMESSIERPPLPDDPSVVAGAPMLEYTLLPANKKGLSTNELFLPKDTRENARELVTQSGAYAAARVTEQTVDLRQNVGAPLHSSVLFTGTGSAIPCKHRNVSGVCLTAANANSMLLDVGEGTVGQLLRQSRDDPESILSRIQAVWISHPHADHHLGILRLLEERPAHQTLVILAPACILNFLREYEVVTCRELCPYTHFECSSLVHDNALAQDMLHESLGIVKCRAVRVAHCRDAFAVILDGTPFGRLAYSGDCRPSQELVAAAKPCDLLIHEATFQDGLEADAVLKKHCTVGEALKIGAKMEAKFIILTHFSQRYPKIPEIGHDCRDQDDVVFAFDFLRVTPASFHKAVALTESLRLLYNDRGENKDADERGKQKSTAVMEIPGLFAQPGVL